MHIFSCSVIQSGETKFAPWNCSQEGLWIILSNWVMISGKKWFFFFQLFKCIFWPTGRMMQGSPWRHIYTSCRAWLTQASEEDVWCALAKPLGNPLLRQRLTDLAASTAQKQAKRQRLNPVTSCLTDWWGGKCSVIQRADSNMGHSSMANQ